MNFAKLILKYSPTAICLIVLALWFASIFWTFGWTFAGKSRYVAFICLDGSLRIANANDLDGQQGFFADVSIFRVRYCLGGFECDFASNPNSRYGSYDANVLMVPIPVVLTLLLPVAIGPYCSYRFPLWSWFMWITLFASETTFYRQVPLYNDTRQHDGIHAAIRDRQAGNCCCAIAHTGCRRLRLS